MYRKTTSDRAFPVIPLCAQTGRRGLARSLRSKPVVVGCYCSLASVFGGTIGYRLDFWLLQNGLREFAFEPVPGFTPLPRKVATVMARACYEDANFWVLLSASALSRFPRAFRTVWLLNRYGQSALIVLTRQFGRLVLLLMVVVLAIVL